MGRSRGAGRVGLLWSVLLLVIILSATDLLRGRDSALRGWWADLHGGPTTPGSVIKALITKPGGLRSR